LRPKGPCSLLIGLHRRRRGIGEGRKQIRKPIAELRDGVGEGKQAGGDNASGEMEGVAGGVEVAFEDGGLLAAQRNLDREQIEAGRAGGLRRSLCGAGRGGRRRGAEHEIAERDGVGAERRQVQRFAGELE
jgi:hypothetical protein